MSKKETGLGRPRCWRVGITVSECGGSGARDAQTCVLGDKHSQ